MNKNWTIKGLIFLVVFQIVVLATEYLNAVYPLWTGQEVKLKVVPVDPRSLFRGNYARLNYDISRITPSKEATIKIPRNGEIIYVIIKPNKDGIHSYTGASFEEPAEGLFLRGRISKQGGSGNAPFRVRYGIEAYFAPKQKALALEKKLRKGGIAQIMVAANGKATLKDIIPN